MTFRKTNNLKLEKQKIIKCPYCHKQLTAINAALNVKLYKYPYKTTGGCHEYRKCNYCGETVGIIFTLE